MFTLHFFIVTTFLTNLFFVAIGSIIAYNPIFPVALELRLASLSSNPNADINSGDFIRIINPLFCSFGTFPTIFALLILETFISNENSRRLSPN